MRATRAGFSFGWGARHRPVVASRRTEPSSRHRGSRRRGNLGPRGAPHRYGSSPPPDAVLSLPKDRHAPRSWLDWERPQGWARLDRCHASQKFPGLFGNQARCPKNLLSHRFSQSIRRGDCKALCALGPPPLPDPPLPQNSSSALLVLQRIHHQTGHDLRIEEGGLLRHLLPRVRHRDHLLGPGRIHEDR